jgi:5-formyltetrahydrofolate cyclo-ligase
MKEIVRKELIKIRNNLKRNEIIQKSKLIKNRLFNLTEFSQASTILFYISYGNEVFTHDMIKESMQLEKKVIVPKTDKKNRQIILSKLKNWKDLEKGSYGILEPNQINYISIEEIELILIPGVGYDSNGNRIGHGKGYYDNLLKKSKEILHIGLAFEIQIIEKIPTRVYDIPVDKIITEERVINCKRV